MLSNGLSDIGDTLQRAILGNHAAFYLMNKTTTVLIQNSTAQAEPSATTVCSFFQKSQVFSWLYGGYEPSTGTLNIAVLATYSRFGYV